jgi:hypothetical protein
LLQTDNGKIVQRLGFLQEAPPQCFMFLVENVKTSIYTKLQQKVIELDFAEHISYVEA